MSVYLLRIIGLLIMVAVLSFAGVLWARISRIDEEIEAEAEKDYSGEE